MPHPSAGRTRLRLAKLLQQWLDKEHPGFRIEAEDLYAAEGAYRNGQVDCPVRWHAYVRSTTGGVREFESFDTMSATVRNGFVVENDDRHNTWHVRPPYEPYELVRKQLRKGWLTLEELQIALPDVTPEKLAEALRRDVMMGYIAEHNHPDAKRYQLVRDLG